MGLKYKKDNYLDFLQDQDNTNLDVLVRLLIFDKDGKKRYTEELSGSEKYVKHEPDHQKYWEHIAAEYQKFAGNSLRNLFRFHGVPYDEVLKDVCKKMKVKFSKDNEVTDIEQKLLLKIMEDTFEQMSDKEREKFLRDLNIDTTSFTKQAAMAAMQAALRGSGFMAYKFAVIIANIIAKQLIGHGLRLAANAGIVRAIGALAGPVGWAITGVWTAVDLSGPAYRVTIPATIYIAALRQAELNKDFFEIQCPHCGTLVVNSELDICENCGGIL